jgi:hypothetical protein
MTTPHLHVLGIDPGKATGWCLLTVPRLCIFGDEPSAIWEFDYGELHGDEEAQAIELARLAREIQGLDYKTGPAVMSEDWDIDPHFKSTDPETLSPVRIGAMLRLLHYQDKMGDSTLHFQSRSLPQGSKATTDERLKRAGLYVPGPDHIRMATKHAIIVLRRARENEDFAHSLWPYPPNGQA